MKFELTGEGEKQVARLAIATGQDVGATIDAAMYFYEAMLKARFQGRHAGIANHQADLAVVFLSLFPGDAPTEPAKADPAPPREPKFKVGDRVLFCGRKGVVVGEPDLTDLRFDDGHLGICRTAELVHDDPER